MVEQLRPDLLQREVNVKADGVQTAFRLMRQVCTPPRHLLPGAQDSRNGLLQLRQLKLIH